MKRSKRHALAAAAAPKPPPTPRHLSRRKQEQRVRRNLLIGVGVSVLIALLVVGYGYWREVLTLGGQPIAEVAGQSITTETYARYLAYQQALIDQQMSNLSQLATAQRAASPEQPSSAVAGMPEAKPQQPNLDLAYQQVIGLLQQRRRILDTQALDEMVEGILIRREATALGIALTEEDINAEIIAQAKLIREGPFPFLLQIEGEPETPSPTLEEAMTEVRAVLARSGNALTEAQYREFVVEPRVLRQKLEAEIGKDVATTSEQVHARHILVDEEEVAKEIRERLAKGEDFAALAKELSKDTSNKEKGGDLGWFSRGQMVKEFEDAAFAAQAGQVLDPVKTQFGWHVIEVLEKDANHPLSEDQLRQARSKQFQEWLAKQKSEAVYQQTPGKVQWALDFAERLRTTPPSTG